MIARRPHKTFVDYAAIAVCPVLIMLLVGSLVFFLLQVGYAGSHTAELRWTLFWFVFAMVLVSRIAIEKGYDHAGVYGVGLAAATAFMLMRYAAMNLAVWCLLGLIWWATNKLTWDCTVIDDDCDASGEGLLQAARLDPEERSEEGIRSPKSEVRSPKSQLERGERNEEGTGTGGTPGARRASVWKRWFGKRPGAAKQPHAPGLWVIYFSLGALAIFGLGQNLIPASDAAARQSAFFLLGVYLAATLGLLLISSFLGLRRYLRQRQLEMPAAMSATWLAMGSAIGLSILAACILLPRPQANWSLTAMIDRLGDPLRSAGQGRVAPPKSPPDQRGGGTAQKQDGPAADEKASKDGDGKTGSSKAGPAGKDERQAGGGEKATSEPGPSRASGEPKGRVEPTPPAQDAQGGVPPAAARRPALSLSPRFANLLKTALYAVLMLLGLYWAIKHKDRLLAGLREFWRALLEFWAGLFARQPAAAAGGAADASANASPSHPFAAFSNPFASGRAAQMAPADLIAYTYDGLEAWAGEHRCGRRPEQTPFEFAAQLSEQIPDLALEVQQLARLYVQVAYANAASLPACKTLLESLWSQMTSG